MPRLVVAFGLNIVSDVPFISPFSQTYLTESKYQPDGRTSEKFETLAAPAEQVIAAAHKIEAIAFFIKSYPTIETEKIAMASLYHVAIRFGSGHGAQKPCGDFGLKIRCSKLLLH